MTGPWHVRRDQLVERVRRRAKILIGDADLLLSGADVEANVAPEIAVERDKRLSKTEREVIARERLKQAQVPVEMLKIEISRRGASPHPQAETGYARAERSTLLRHR